MCILEINSFYWNEQTSVRQYSKTLDISVELSTIFSNIYIWINGFYAWKNFLVVFFEKVGIWRFSGAFDHLTCQHTVEFDQNFSKSQMPGGLPGGEGGGGGGMGCFGIDWYIKKTSGCPPPRKHF